MIGDAVKDRPRETLACDIPADHLDLVARPLNAALTTLLPDGQPQTQPVWFSYDAPCVLINTMRGFRKERNLRADGRATVLVIDPANSNRWLEVRGQTELTEEGARAHLDELARLYAGVDHFFGGCVSADLEQIEFPVIGRITPTRVVDERSDEHTPPLLASPLTSAPTHENPISVALPATHRDLLGKPLVAILSTLMPDGHPQTQPVWFEFDGVDLSINTSREKQKGRNMVRDPRATLLIVDPSNPNRWIEIRSRVEVSEAGALEHLDRLTRLYTKWPSYYDYVHPLDRRARETRIICRLIPQRVICDAIFSPAHRMTELLAARARVSKLGDIAAEVAHPESSATGRAS